MINAQQVAGAINDPEFYNSPLTSLVCVENTTNKGWCLLRNWRFTKIKEVCVANNLKFHMDGARIWNALVAKKQDPKLYGPIFDTICLFSKGLRASRFCVTS
jgi:threonine aldolase